MNTKALLIIDMQQGSFTTETPRYDTEGVVQRMNELAELCRQKSWPVIWVQHDGTGTGEYEKNAPDWQLLEDLQVKPGDVRLDKYANDVFYQSELQAILLENGVGEVFITGCATDFCVEATVQSALAKDYNVTVVADGHTTSQRPNLAAEQVIQHYNWVWQNMIPTEGQVSVKPLKEIAENILAKA